MGEGSGMGMHAKDASTGAETRFRAEAAQELRLAISEAGGNEVFAAAKLDPEGYVCTVEVVARGTRSAVPALTGYLERGDIIVHNHPSGYLAPSDADVAVAAEAGSAGVGCYIVDNDVLRVAVVAEPVRRRSYTTLDVEEIGGVLEPGGKLARLIPAYEPRESQSRLARDIARSMNEGSVLVAEAGTGVGKSFAYLIPAIAWAVRNEERVVIATATITLQKQLVDKDIPQVQALFRKKTKAVLVKGRGNYLCRARLKEALEEEGMLAGEDHPLRRMDAWASSGVSGDRADLSFWPEDEQWQRVCSESDSCTGLRCRFRQDCFVLKARKEASDAQILIANHHILFSDLAARMHGAGYEQTAVMPPFRAIIFDEAHAIEASATSLFSSEFTRFAIFRRLSRLQRRHRGLSFGIVTRLTALPSFPAAMLDALPAAIRDCREAAAELDRLASGIFDRERSYRLVTRDEAVESLLFTPLKALENSLIGCASILGKALEATPEELVQEQAVHETRLAHRSIMDLVTLCARFQSFEEEGGETVFWLSRSRTSRGDEFIEYSATPLDIGSTMNEAVYSRFRSLIFTSATLSVGESFGYWMARTGLTTSGREVTTALYPSPFPYRTCALLALDRTAPLPDRAEFATYIDTAIARLLEASRGRALVLFTSRDAMTKAFEAARPVFEKLSIRGMRQGDDERGRLLSMFRQEISSVLFATDSFWEGVDAPGETLSLVIICRLPFRVPTDPVQCARSEAVEKRGGHPFMEISLPEAVIRLKQGFGRLIRHSEDRGVVAVLDSRILAKGYGQLFVKSLPPCRIVAEDLESMSREVGRFLDSQ